MEKTLESPLDSKEINSKSVNSKGNQSWIFIGKTDAEVPIIWSPDVKNRLLGKDSVAGKDWRQEAKGRQRMRCWMESLTRWTWVWASSGRWWRTGELGMLQPMGLQRAGHEGLNNSNNNNKAYLLLINKRKWKEIFDNCKT